MDHKDFDPGQSDGDRLREGIRPCFLIGISADGVNRRNLLQLIENYRLVYISGVDYSVTACQSIGDLRPENVEIVKAHFPEDYETIKRIFPYIEAQEKQNEFKKQRHTASGVE